MKPSNHKTLAVKKPETARHHQQLPASGGYAPRPVSVVHH